MRLRLFGLTLLLSCLCALTGRAEVAVYNDISYVFPAQAQAPGTLSLSVQGETIDPETFEARVLPSLPGAVFAVYARDASGAFVPFPDPKDPSEPLTLVTGDAPLSVRLPLSIDLYLRQVAAPEGYLIDPKEEAYLPLSLPGEVVVTNRREDARGLYVAVITDGPSGPAPLSGVSLTLSGAGGPYALVTDEGGVASVKGLAPGAYTLLQQAAPDGLSIDEPEVSAVIPESGVVRVSLHNSAGGFLTLRALGLSADNDGGTRLVPIDRRYAVYDSEGALVGDIATGETLSLPAARQGRAYTLRALGAPDDGFAPDGAAREVFVFPGQTAECRAVVESQKGFYAFSHVSALDDSPVPGGTFQVLDAAGREVETFTADADGRHTPQSPLPAGTYAVRMLRAAEGHQYADEAAVFTVEPALRSDRPKASISIASLAVPIEMKTPKVTAEAQALASLFEKDARVSFTFSLFGGAPALPVSEVSYTPSFPEIEGLSVLFTAEDGATLSVARRYPLPGVDEVRALTVTGTVSYAYTYRVSPDETAKARVSAPFACEVAAFVPLSSASDFAVSGHVADADGRPVRGLPVALEDASGALEFDRTVTDPFGAYAFETLPEGGRVRFSPPAGYGVLSRGADAVLLPERTVKGRVVAFGGLEGYPATLTFGSLGQARPDADGRFSFTGVFAPGDALGVLTPEGVLSAVETDGEEVLVSLYAAASVLGRLADPDGAPVAGASVALTGEGVSLLAITSADGAYLFAGLFPGAYEVAVAPPEGFLSAGGGEAAFSLAAGQAYDAGQALVMRPAAIEGTLSESGAPLSGARVTLSPTGAEAVTGEDGRFVFEGLTLGGYALSVNLSGDAMISGLPEAIEIAHSGQREALSLSVTRPARLSGRVWYDDNDDGLLSAGEGGLSGAAVTLRNDRGEDIASLVTGGDGGFAFERLAPGAYRVAVSLPESMIFARPAPDTKRLIVGVNDREGVSDPIILSSGQAVDGLLCGATVAGSVSGVVWDDLDGDGVRREGEPALSGAEVALWRGGAAVQTVRTGADGAYRFSNVRTGDYALFISLPDGYWFTRQPAASAGDVVSHLPGKDAGGAAYDLSVRRQRPDFTVNAGAVRTASVEVSVWLDENADGRRGAEGGYGGLSVALMAGGRAAGEAVTDAAGVAAFGAVRPGEYVLRYALPSDGYGFTAGVERTLVGYGESAALSVRGGESVKAEAALSRYGRIFGIVFADADYDGLRAEADAGVAATVTLLDRAGAAVAETVTGPDGRYAFEKLFSGTYAVRFTLPSGYVFTKNREDAPSFDSDVPETKDGTAQTAPLFLPMGEALLIDAGAYKAASVSGSVWQDARESGRYAAGNPPLAGVAVTLLRAGEMYARTVSGEDGRFAFSLLPPGTYALRAELPGGMRFSEAAGEADRASRIGPTEESVGETPAFALGMGEAKAEIDIGAVYVGSLSGMVGDKKTGAGMAGVAIEIVRNGEVGERVRTDGEGQFRFDALRPGAVEVRLTPPDGFALSTEQEGAMVRTVLQGAEAAPVSLALQPESVIAGGAWLDANYDGVWDAGEAPLSGVAVSLRRIGEDSEDLKAVTGADGMFRFDKLLPGSYRLSAEPFGGVLLSRGEVEVSLGMGEERTVDLPAFRPAMVSGSVFEDLNDDGLRAAQEPPLEGVLVELVDSRGNVLQETVTNAKGAYVLEDLPPALCAVRFTLPEGYAFGRRTQGGSVVEAADGPVASTDPMRLTMGEKRAGVLAGALRSGRIGDLVWLDENGNGLMDTGEPGVSGVRVTLWRALDGGLTELAGETRTDAHGRYRFDGVRPGWYQVSFDLGGAYLPTRAVKGLAQISSKLPWAARPTISTEVFLLSSGEQALHIDAGVVTPTMADAFGWTVKSNGTITD